MLQLDPLSRPSLAEVKEHEWFKKPIPTHDQIVAEFKERAQMIDKTCIKQGED